MKGIVITLCTLVVILGGVVVRMAIDQKSHKLEFQELRYFLDQEKKLHQLNQLELIDRSDVESEIKNGLEKSNSRLSALEDNSDEVIARIKANVEEMEAIRAALTKVSREVDSVESDFEGIELLVGFQEDRANQLETSNLELERRLEAVENLLDTLLRKLRLSSGF